MCLFEFDHLQFTMCVYDCFEDQERHNHTFGGNSHSLEEVEVRVRG